MNDLVKHQAPPGREKARPLQEQYVNTPAGAVTPRALIEKLRKRIGIVVVVTLLVVIPAGIATYLAIPLYRSTALIQVTPEPVQVLPYRDVADASTSGNYEPYMATQDQVLRGPSLAKRVVARLTATGDQTLAVERDKIYERFSVRRVPNSQLFEIGYLAPSPKTAARVVNIFAEEYIKQQLESSRSTREKARESLQRELEQLERRVQASESELASYTKQKNMFSAAPGQGDLVQTRLAALDQLASTADADLITAQTRVDVLEKASVQRFPERLVTPVITALTSQLLQQEQELTNLLARFGENWPAVVAKRGEVTLLQQQLTREKTASLAQSKEQAQIDLRAAQARYSSISSTLNQQKELVDRYNSALIQYNILRREVETSQRLYEGVLERLRQTSVQGGLSFGNVQVLEPGLPINRIESPRVAWNLSIASLLGLALGIGVVLVLEFWDSSLSTTEEMEDVTRLPALGSVPNAKALRKGERAPGERETAGATLNLSTVSKAVYWPSGSNDGQVAESIRAVCASIFLSQSDRQLRVILVTSAIPAEGKTTVVRELGKALAETGAETLIVEADLRAPALSQAFGISEPDGLSLFLSGHTQTPKIQQTSQPRLSIVSAGPRPPNPVALLSSDRMSALLKQAASSFRFVVLDSPPVLAVADARVLAALADGVILVVRARKTSRSLVKKAQAALQNYGSNTLGAILNGADDPQSGYYAKYYHRA